MKTILKRRSKTLPPNTTEEENTVTAGQRVINLIWEKTQSKIALYVIIVNLFVNSFLTVAAIVFDLNISDNQLALLSLCLQPISLTMGIVIGFYFSRTNHSAIGGTGKKMSPSNIGTR